MSPRGVLCKLFSFHLVLVDVIRFCAFCSICGGCRAFIVDGERELRPNSTTLLLRRFQYPPTIERPWPKRLLNWPCCPAVRGYSRGGFCRDECAAIAKIKNMTNVVCSKGTCQCENYHHEKDGRCEPDARVSLHILLMVYLAGIPLLSVVLVVAAVMQYLFDRYCFVDDDAVAQGLHETDDVESANAEDTEAGHRVQFLDGGKPEGAVEYDWAYEDWHADNPEDRLSQMLLGALSKGSRRIDK